MGTAQAPHPKRPEYFRIGIRPAPSFFGTVWFSEDFGTNDLSNSAGGQEPNVASSRLVVDPHQKVLDGGTHFLDATVFLSMHLFVLHSGGYFVSFR